METLSKPDGHSTGGLEMADEIKKDQGFHECEVSTSEEPREAESDLHKQLIFCRKNPGHKVFIPSYNFNIEHLPTRFQDNDMFNFIKALIFLTVRVCVKYTSFDRPQTYPGTNEPYPFYNNRGKKCLRTGTGRVWLVHKYTEENKRKEGMEGQTCPCEQCKNSPTPMRQWYKVNVMTAKHVVFDAAEAKHTTCQLFYDSDEDNSKIQELEGELMMSDTNIKNTMWTEKNINHDRSDVSCCTHDLELGKKIEKIMEVFDNLVDKLMYKFKNSGIERPMTVIVSHPHGRSKQVTVGEMTHREEVGEYQNERFTRYTYTTQTCPGSSGAPVFALGKFGFCLHPHSKRCIEDGFNMSGIWWD